MFGGNSSKGIWQRNSIFFFIYIIFYATINIFPQFFFLEYYPEEKNTYLLIILIIGSLLSIAGVQLAQSFRYKWPDVKKVVIIVFLSSSILGPLLFIVPHWIPYVLALLLLKFLINFIMQFIDQYLVPNTSRDLLAAHSNSNSLYQLIAIILSSLYLGLYYDNSLLNLVIFALLPLISLYLSLNKFPRIIVKESHEVQSVIPVQKLKSSHKNFLIYSAFVFCAYGIFSSMLIYFLNDYYSINDPKTKGGIILALTCVAGALSILFISPKIIRLEKGAYAPKAVLGMSLINITNLILFIMRPYQSFTFILILCVITGLCYGLFMSLSRNIISQFANEEPNSKVLSIYNNLPNYSFLFGFIITLLIQWIAPLMHINSHMLSLITITLYFPISLWFFTKSLRSFRTQI